MTAAAGAGAVPAAVTAAFCLLCAGAAVQDLRRFRIANGWSLALLLLGVAALTLQPAAAAPHAVSLAMAFAGATLLFAVGWFGGGDAKLLSAAAFAFAPAALPAFLLTIAAAGAVVAVAAMARPGTLSQRRARRIPYGLPIAIGAIAIAMYTGVYGQPHML